MRAAVLLVFACALAAAQDNGGGDTRFSLAIGDEFSASRDEAGNLALIGSSFLYRHQDRWRVSTSIAGVMRSSQDTHAQFRIREAYAGVTLGDFDFTAGRRILRWGTGYAFTPTGVLDPPRNAADPTDRLGLNEGREMVSTDWIHGRHAVTAGLAGGERMTTAVRYNTLIAGFDSAVIYAHDRGLRDFWGANFTRVFGEALEIHGEIAHRDNTAVLIGGKYMLPGSIGTIAEFYSPGDPRAGRFAFFSAGKSRLRELPGWKQWDVVFSMVANTRDRSRILILDVTRRIGDHFTATLRAQAPHGMIPYAAQISTGLWYRL